MTEEEMYVEDREVMFVTETRQLTDDDLLEAGQKLAEYEEKLSVVQAEAKQQAAEFRGKIADVEAARAALARVIRLKEEEVVHECFADPDYAAGMMVFTDVDTGEEIDRRKLTNEEKQMKIMDMQNRDGGEINSEGLEE